MGTVLPPWKLELIEKKRKRLEQEKTKEKQKVDRFSNIPEWKRLILSKRKGEQTNEDPSANNEGKTNHSIENDQTNTSAKKPTQSCYTDGHTLNHDTNSSNERVIPNERLRNGDIAGHSSVANCVSLSDKHREEDQPSTLSKTETSQESDSEDFEQGRVLYEHIKTPSELRRLYELQVARKKALEEPQQSKDISSSARDKSSLGSVNDSQVSKSTHKRDTTPAKPNHTTDVKPNGTIQKEEITKQTQIVRLSDKESLETNPPASSEINHQHATDNSKKDNELQNGDDSSAEIHVQTIRNKFGPSGYFRRRSVSSDNLLKSSSEHTSPSSSPKARPSPLNKRWSMVALTRDSDNSDEFSPPSTDPLKRARSLSDVRSGGIGEHHDIPNLKHRASVSHDIEHRIHELLHHLPVSDGDDEWEDEQILTNEKVPQNTIPKKSEEEPRKERRASWFTPDEDNKATKSNQISHLPQDEKSLQNNTVSTNEKSNKPVKERNEMTNQKSTKSVNNSNKREVVKEKNLHADNAETSESIKPNLHDSGIDINDVAADDKNEKRPSVHKLSALFGSSISKGIKSKQNNKVDSNQETKQDSKTNSNKSESKGNRKFPWMKKSSDDNKNKNDSTSLDTKFPFKASQDLKHVQNKRVEQKITGNMTLVTGGGNKNNPVYNHGKLPINNLTPSTSNSKNIHTSTTPSSVHTTKKPPNIDYDDDYITIIDVPDTSRDDDIQVSAIDIPESASPTPVSVIDMPEIKDSGVKVSVIDIPQDSDSDSDSDSGTSGSYDVNPSGPNIFTFEKRITESIHEEEEEEEDIDNVPVSYFGDSTYMKVPEVIFETKRENVKSILSSPLRKRKVRYPLEQI